MSFFGEHKKYIACWIKIKRWRHEARNNRSMCYNQFGSNETNLCNVYVQRTELSCVKYIERKLSNFLESNETRIRNKYCQSVFHINNSTLHQWFPCQLFDTLLSCIWQYFFFNRYILIRMKKFQDFIVYLSVNKESISLSIRHNYVSWFTIYTNKSSNIVR